MVETAPLKLHSLAELAEVLRCSSTKTARRRLLDAMAADPGLRVVRRGRTILLTEAQMQQVVRALEWRPASASSSSCETRRVSARKPLGSACTAQQRAYELMQTLRQRPRKASSDKLRSSPRQRSSS